MPSTSELQDRIRGASVYVAREIMAAVDATIGSGASITIGHGSEKQDEQELRRLMALYQQGHREAIEELVDRLSPILWRFFAASGLSRPDIQDLVQDCWLRIHRARGTYRDSEPALPWIFAVARHTRLDAYRRWRRRQSKEILVDRIPDTLAAESQPNLEYKELGQMLEALPEGQREVILMLKISGMSLEDVARATGSTVGSVKQKAHRAYKTLRATFEKQGG